MPRRSRAWRSFPPKSSISAVTLDNLRKRCQTHEHPDGGETGRAGVSQRRETRIADAANRDDRQRRTRAHLAQRIESRDRMSGRLSLGWKDGAEQQVVAST